MANVCRCGIIPCRLDPPNQWLLNLFHLAGRVMMFLSRHGTSPNSLSIKYGTLYLFITYVALLYSVEAIVNGHAVTCRSITCIAVFTRNVYEFIPTLILQCSAN